MTLLVELNKTHFYFILYITSTMDHLQLQIIQTQPDHPCTTHTFNTFNAVLLLYNRWNYLSLDFNWFIQYLRSFEGQMYRWCHYYSLFLYYIKHTFQIAKCLFSNWQQKMSTQAKNKFSHHFDITCNQFLNRWLQHGSTTDKFCLIR